jgi:hypothetical protein
MSVLRFATLFGLPALLASCGQDETSRPPLTSEAFFKAAKDCNAVDPTFIFRTEELPSIAFTVKSPEETSGETAQCLADALAGFQLKSMEIRIAPRP